VNLDILWTTLRRNNKWHGSDYTAEQIIGYLRQAEVMIGRGKHIEEVLREIDVTANTYYRWRKEYGGLEWIRPDV
jgi:hypothetical protein